MHIHILGICGTFMGSLAQLAKSMGHRVTGSDKNVYPPMSTQLEAAGIELIEGFDPSQLDLNPDLVVVGNVVSRGNPVMEAVLNRGLAYTSGPQWLCEHLLEGKWVLAVSGTHGKTTTSSMLAWILEYAGMSPGFLIGGVPGNFSVSARLGESDFFVIEADEYDTAFFDKRSKFVHYRPRTLVINNLEFDHADIFPDLAAIQTQFHHLIRMVPADGLVISPQGDVAIEGVLEKGCWSVRQLSDSVMRHSENQGSDWALTQRSADGSEFTLGFQGEQVGHVAWPLTGTHNIANAIHAIAAARHVGIAPDIACQALSEFKGVKRRMELFGEVGNVRIYDDFAHHPTAIQTTLEGIRARVESEKGQGLILAVIEPRSNTMRCGIHKSQLRASAASADQVFWSQSDGMAWSLADYVQDESNLVCQDMQMIVDSIVHYVRAHAGKSINIVVMSNGGFGGLHAILLEQLRLCAESEVI